VTQLSAKGAVIYVRIFLFRRLIRDRRDASFVQTLIRLKRSSIRTGKNIAKPRSRHLSFLSGSPFSAIEDFENLQDRGFNIDFAEPKRNDGCREGPGIISPALSISYMAWPDQSAGKVHFLHSDVPE
jgi:hypothetical protein